MLWEILQILKDNKSYTYWTICNVYKGRKCILEIDEIFLLAPYHESGTEYQRFQRGKGLKGANQS